MFLSSKASSKSYPTSCRKQIRALCSGILNKARTRCTAFVACRDAFLPVFCLVWLEQLSEKDRKARWLRCLRLRHTCKACLQWHEGVPLVNPIRCCSSAQGQEIYYKFHLAVGLLFLLSAPAPEVLADFCYLPEKRDSGPVYFLLGFSPSAYLCGRNMWVDLIAGVTGSDRLRVDCWVCLSSVSEEAWIRQQLCVLGISASDLNLFQLGCVICVGMPFRNQAYVLRQPYTNKRLWW